jgi:hypoxanthine-DNA glycosylase
LPGLEPELGIIFSFTPVIDKKARILILGSMPGSISLAKKEYYANPNNQFWPLIYAIFGVQPDSHYADRKAFLKSRKIALWDVIHKCERADSSDAKIMRPVVNDFDNLLRRYPDIKFLFFNGKKAESVFQHKVNDSIKNKVSLYTLPSSSPANARVNLDTKIKAWALIKEKYNNESCSPGWIL